MDVVEWESLEKVREKWETADWRREERLEQNSVHTLWGVCVPLNFEHTHKQTVGCERTPLFHTKDLSDFFTKTTLSLSQAHSLCGFLPLQISPDCAKVADSFHSSYKTAGKIFRMSSVKILNKANVLGYRKVLAWLKTCSATHCNSGHTMKNN